MRDTDMNEDNDLPCWAKAIDGWRKATEHEEEKIEDDAGCGGRCFVNDRLEKAVLCDGSDLVLFSCSTKALAGKGPA